MSNALNACAMRTGPGVTLRAVWEPVVAQDARRAVNLSVSSELLADARKAGINLSALFERTLIAELKQLRRQQWHAENVRAVAAYNEDLMLHGACFQGRWGD